MNNLKLSYKIVLINVAIAILISIVLFATTTYSKTAVDFAFEFGTVCLGLGMFNLFIAFISLASNNKDLRKGFFLSSAAMLLLSGISCGGGLLYG